MAILVTGGTGFIGSHTVVELLSENKEVVILDNLSNSKREVVDKITKITGKKAEFYKGNILNPDDIEKVFTKHKIDGVIHFAGLKAVGESTEKPLDYYHNNITGTLNLCNIMKNYGCKNMVFSSSATVYGDPASVPVKEDFPTSATNPYGATKLFIERILSDLHRSDNSWNIVLLRYFNPIGADKSGLIGENPNGIPNNLMPYIMQVAVGKLEYLRIFGNDYDTPDGTGVRDYIHVSDLSYGHILALKKCSDSCGLVTYNLGTGKGYSVLEIVRAFETTNEIQIPYKIIERRSGDIAKVYADVTKAKKELGFTAKLGITEMCKDSFNYIKSLQN